jgi:bifunctional UDP-N-acetylglucosamine pyrophosphorylase/glucosamine-1-phosphate N-acetyltransferase
LTTNYQILVLAAGKGARFRSKTPKVLHKVLGITLLERVIRAAAPLNPVRIQVVVGTGRAEVEEELKRLGGELGVEIVSAVQEQPLGTGDAVRAGLEKLGDSSRVLIIPGDSPLITTDTLREIIRLDQDNSHPHLGVISCEPPSPFGYGRIVKDEQGRILKIVEEKDCSESQRSIREINSALYVAEPQFLRESVRTLKPINAQGELYFTDTVEYGVGNGKSVTALKVANWLDLAGANTRAELSALEREARRRVNTRLMLEGVTLEDPESTYVEEGVKVGEDSFLGAGTRLYGKTTLGKEVSVDGDTLIVDSVVGDGSHIKFGSMIEESELQERCVVGPFAHLRPRSKLAAEVHIGNFVETKAAVIGRGTKANHLTYIGDAVVGEKVNFGAGTITANYDGFKKHKTEIGDGASTGSNSVLVAPVKVGKGAYIGAGSVVRKEVPEDALMVSRAEEQVVKEWAKKRRERFNEGAQ